MEYFTKQVDIFHILDTSALDADDLNGPGLCKFPRLTGELSSDFGRFILSTYSQSKNFGDRLRFVTNLGELMGYLGAEIFPLLLKYTDDAPDIRAQMAKQLQVLPPQEVFPLLEKLMTDEDLSIVKDTCQAAIQLIKNQPLDKVTSLVLRLVNDENTKRRLIGLETFKELIPYLDSDLNIYFVAPVIISMKDEISNELKMKAVECIPALIMQISDRGYKIKLLKTYHEFLKTEIRHSACNVLGELYRACDEALQVDWLHMQTLKLLGEGIKNAGNQLGPILSASDVPVPQDFLMIYAAMCRNPETQYNCAFYFPGIILLRGVDLWSVLKDTLVHMAKEGSVDTKSCIAAFAHDLAKMIGPEETKEVLLPLYLKLYKATKTKVIENLNRLMRQLELSDRTALLPLMTKAYKDKSWRLRLKFARIISDIAELYPINRLRQDIWPFILGLMNDNCEAIRQALAEGLGNTVLMMLKAERADVPAEFVDLAFAKSYRKRQLFALACKRLHRWDKFVNYFGSIFQDLCNDRVVHVRVCCAQVLASVNDFTPYWSKLRNQLKHDFDADVRFEITQKYWRRGLRNLKTKFELCEPLFRPVRYTEDVSLLIQFDLSSDVIMKYI